MGVKTKIGYCFILNGLFIVAGIVHYYGTCNFLHMGRHFAQLYYSFQMLVGCTLEGVKVQPDAKPQAMRPVVVVIMEAAGASVFFGGLYFGGLSAC